MYLPPINSCWTPSETEAGHLIRLNFVRQMAAFEEYNLESRSGDPTGAMFNAAHTGPPIYPWSASMISWTCSWSVCTTLIAHLVPFLLCVKSFGFELAKQALAARQQQSPPTFRMAMAVDHHQNDYHQSVLSWHRHAYVGDGLDIMVGTNGKQTTSC